MASTSRKLWNEPLQSFNPASFSKLEKKKIEYKWPDLIISTENYIFIFKNKNFEELMHEVGARYYGITWTLSDVYLSTHDGVMKFYKNFKNKYSISLGSQDIHQIYANKYRVYVLQTKAEVISEHTTDLMINKRFCGATEGKDLTHINSIFLCRSLSNFYLCHHNHVLPSFISLHTNDKYFKEIKRIENVGKMNHNIYAEGNLLYTLSSGEGEIKIINLIDNSINGIKVCCTETELPSSVSFVRGLARGRGYFIIGVCANVPREKRNDEKSYLLMYDSSMNFLDKIELPIPDQIRDIRIISEIDMAHNEILFPFSY